MYDDASHMAALAEMTIRPATVGDAEAIAAIYNHYVANTTITFEEDPVAADDMARRIAAVLQVSLPWLVIEAGERMVGYAYATPWRARSAYRFSVEVSVYLAPGQARGGLGTRLYEALFPLLHARGIHTVIGGIALPNDASIALHEKFGLRKVAHFEAVGYKFDQWLDVGYWQRTF